MADTQPIVKTLSREALGVIEGYQGIPYYNNNRREVRMGLRVLVGKGSFQEIADETMLYALREKVSLSELSPSEKKRFMIKHNLGVDCSALAYYILDAEARARGKGSLAHHLVFPFANSLLSRLVRILRGRYVENADVRTFAHPLNSHEVNLRDVEPGDFFLKIDYERNHMMIVTCVTNDNLEYVHSVALPSDGRYDHGVRTETLPREALAKWGLRRLNCF